MNAITSIPKTIVQTANDAINLASVLGRTIVKGRKS